MHGSFGKSGEVIRNIHRDWGIGVFALPVLLVVVLVGLAIARPDVSNWISEATQAEFASSGQLPEVTPTQVARPSMEPRTVRAY